MSSIVLYGHEALRRAATTTTPGPHLADVTNQLARQMLEAGLIGLAANQLARPERLFTYVDVDADEPTVGATLNPTVISTSEQRQTDLEGCGSLPGLYAPVTRPLHALFTYQRIDGANDELAASGLLARLWLHETDHLNGVVFLDHLAAHDAAAAEVHWRALLDEAGGDPHRAARLGHERPYHPAVPDVG